MDQGHYNWDPKGPPPKIKQHSIAKHKILRSYLVKYIETLLSSGQRQDTFKLTLVDGFSGGGIYAHETTGELHQGSPLIMLQAVKEAEATINCKRTYPVKFLVHYFFIEEDTAAHECLLAQLKLNGYGKQLGETIFVFKSAFVEQSAQIQEFILRKSQRAARAIFLLDQYGFSKVPTGLASNLLRTLPGAEIIFTFAVDALITYLSDDPTSHTKISNIGLNDPFNGRSIKDIKRTERRTWRAYIQSRLYQSLITECNARYFTPFFIRSTQGHGDYWLIHLSQHSRARDVMTRIHWQENNYFVHYGGAGLNMLNMIGYVPEEDDTFTKQSSLFCFDDEARDKSITSLHDDLADVIYSAESAVKFNDLFARTCNGTPADAGIYKETLFNLASEMDIAIIGENGHWRKSKKTIREDDYVMPHPNRRFIFT